MPRAGASSSCTSAEAAINYYERHIGDYLKDTAHLSLLEHGIYTRLLDVYYTREHGIGPDDACRLIGARSKDEKAAVASVLEEFFDNDFGTYKQARCEREIEAYQRKVAHNREVGKLGGRPKKTETQTKPTGLFMGSENLTHIEPEPNPPSLQTPDTRHQTPGAKKEKPPPPSGVSPLAVKVSRPDDVEEQTWFDWLDLRKRKRANVSATTVSEARAEAAKAGIALEQFLRTWCVRGSQGLSADWLKTNERNGTKTFRQADTAAAAARYAEMTGGLLGKLPRDTLEMESIHAQLGDD